MTRAEKFVLSTLPGPGCQGRTFKSLYKSMTKGGGPLKYDEIADAIRGYLSQGIVEDVERNEVNGQRRYYMLTPKGWQERGKLPGTKRMPKAEGMTA